ncbi:MAG: efflux RND transporter periplasmic adaptor subunit [Butyricicoccus sp.]
MKQRTIIHALTAAALTGTMLLSGCGGQSDNSDAVFVQAVSDVAQINVSGNNLYSGIVEAKSVQKVNKSSKKEVEKCYVKEGDVVHKGDKLFKYDIQALELEIQSMELELERMKSEIAAYDTQIAQMQKDLNNASANKKLKYSLDIQEAEIDRAEKQYNYKTKQQEYEKLKKSVGTTVVYSKISGVVQSVNDGSNDDGDNSGAYITILQNNSYRVKGTVSEMNVGSMQEGEAVQVISRLDSTQTWDGTISSINTDQTVKDDSENYYDDGSSGEQSSKYNFYVKLSSSEDLLMGQHVYIQLGEEDPEEAGAIKLSSAYIVQEEDGTSYIWAATGRNKLEKRTVTLGSYDEFNDTYAVLDGLSEDDYIAFPEEGLEEGQKTMPYDEAELPADDSGEEEIPAEDGTVPSMSTTEPMG